jgi:hypothetical protein
LQGFFLMVTKTPEVPDRKPRADAQRNRERILEVAKLEFTRSGANASLASAPSTDPTRLAPSSTSPRKTFQARRVCDSMRATSYRHHLMS